MVLVNPSHPMAITQALTPVRLVSMMDVSVENSALLVILVSNVLFWIIIVFSEPSIQLNNLQSDTLP